MFLGGVGVLRAPYRQSETTTSRSDWAYKAVAHEGPAFLCLRKSVRIEEVRPEKEGAALAGCVADGRNQ